MEKVSDVHTSLIVDQRALELGVRFAGGNSSASIRPVDSMPPGELPRCLGKWTDLRLGVVYVQRKGRWSRCAVAHPPGWWWDCRLLAFHSIPWPPS